MYYLIFLLALLYPLYALPFSINESIKRNSSYLPIISFSLAFGALAFVVEPPYGFDLAHHYNRIDSLRGLEFSDVLQKSNTGYLLFDSYAWFINTIGFPKEFFPASIVFTSYLLIFSVFRNLKLNYLINIKKSILLFVFIMFWQAIDFTFLSSGLRNMFAYTIVFYAIYRLISYNNTILFSILSTVAFFIHPAALIPVALVIPSKFLSQYSRFGKSLVILSILLMLTSKYIVKLVIVLATFFENTSFYSPTYVDSDNKWGAGAIYARNINGIVGEFVLARLAGYIAILYLLFKKPKVNNILYFLLCNISLLLGMFFLYFTLYQRLYSLFILLFGLFITLEYYQYRDKFHRYFFIAFTCALIVHSIYHLYRYSDYIFSAKEVLYKPLMFILFGF